MSAEISVSANLSANIGGVVPMSSGSLTKTVDMTGTEGLADIQIVGTSAEAISVGDVATAGWWALKNLDDVNFIELALDSGVATQVFAKLLAGEFIVFPAKTTTLYAKADTANVRIQKVILER